MPLYNPPSAGGAAAWGGITGTLGNQTDLDTELDLKAPLASPTFTGTVAGVTKAMVGLTNASDTSDAAKPISTATQTALDLKSNLASPTFTGTVVLPAQTVTLAMQANMATASLVYRKTAAAGAPEINTLATVKTDLALVKGDVGLGSVDNTTDAGKPVSTATQTALDLKANLSGPTFTGVPAAPTAAVGTNTTQLATTAYALAQPLDTHAATTDIVTLNASTTAHGLLKKLDNISTNFLNGQGNWAAPVAVVADGDKGNITVSASGATWTIDAGVVTEAMQLLADNTTQDVSTTKHGYAPKAPNVATQYLNGTGAWSVPAGGGGGGASLGLIVTTGLGFNLA